MPVVRDGRCREELGRAAAAGQRDDGRLGAREAARVPAPPERGDDAVDDHLGDQAKGGELSARDRHQAARRLEDLLLARHVGRVRVAALRRRDERPEAREGAHHVADAEARVGEVVVDRLEQVRDVVGLDGRLLLRPAVMVRVRRAHERMLAPGDDEHHAAVADGAEHDRGPVADPVPRHHDVHALGEAEPRLQRRVVERGDLVHPRARRVDHDARMDLHLAAAHAVHDACAGDAAALVEEAGDLGVRQHDRALARGGERRLEDEAGVVGAVVEVASAADEAVALHRRLGGDHATAAEHAVPLHAPEAGEHVVERQAGRQLEEADRAAPVDRDDELLRPDQVRGQRPQPLALAHGLEDEAHVPLLQVAEPAVDQLRRAARRAAREVATLDHGGPEAAHRGVARDAGAVDAAADDEDVERLLDERSERGRPKAGRTVRRNRRVPHAAILDQHRPSVTVRHGTPSTLCI